jgi:hypothetical protein
VAFLEHGEGVISREYADYLLMREMHWTYDDLMSTPSSVVSNVRRFINLEIKHKRLRTKNG